jgi:hypothetical protein
VTVAFNEKKREGCRFIARDLHLFAFVRLAHWQGTMPAQQRFKPKSEATMAPNPGPIEAMVRTSRAIGRNKIQRDPATTARHLKQSPVRAGENISDESQNLATKTFRRSADRTTGNGSPVFVVARDRTRRSSCARQICFKRSTERTERKAGART